MVQDMKVNIFKVKSTDMVDLLGLMAALTMVSSLKTISRAKESIIGLIRENMMDNG